MQVFKSIVIVVLPFFILHRYIKIHITFYSFCSLIVQVKASKMFADKSKKNSLLQTSTDNGDRQVPAI